MSERTSESVLVAGALTAPLADDWLPVFGELCDSNDYRPLNRSSVAYLLEII